MRADLAGSDEAAADDWPGMLRACELRSVTSRTFLVDLPAPLEQTPRAFVRAQLSGLRDRLAERLDDDDRVMLERLLDPNAPEGIMRRGDVFFLAARTVHVGRLDT
jgi:hypothetical protein